MDGVPEVFTHCESVYFSLFGYHRAELQVETINMGHDWETTVAYFDHYPRSGQALRVCSQIHQASPVFVQNTLVVVPRRIPFPIGRWSIKWDDMLVPNRNAPYKFQSVEYYNEASELMKYDEYPSRYSARDDVIPRRHFKHLHTLRFVCSSAAWMYPTSVHETDEPVSYDRTHAKVRFMMIAFLEASKIFTHLKDESAPERCICFYLCRGPIIAKKVWKPGSSDVVE